MRIGGIASAVSATRADPNPIPKNGRASARIARLGTARPTLPMLMAMSAPSRVLLISEGYGHRYRDGDEQGDQGEHDVLPELLGKSGRA